MFSLTMLTLIMFMGIGIDYGRALLHREKMLSALDSAVQMAAITRGDQRAKTAAFEGAFNSQFSPSAAIISVKASLDTVTSPTEIIGVATARVRTSLLGVAGISEVVISVKSAGRAATGVEFALVLDVSGSMKWPDMSGMTRIDVLKQAAQNLVNTAVANAGPGANLRFGYVPFTMNVNIGPGNTSYVTGANDPLFAGTQWAGCVLERAPPNHFSTSYSATDKFRAYIYPPEPNSNYCDNPGNGTNSRYRSVDPYVPGNPDPYTHGPNYNCVRHPIQPLTSDANAFKAKLSSLTAEYNMGTILAPGVTWGVRILTPDAPFPGAAASGEDVRKIMVMLTDGGQTTEMRYPFCSWARNPSTPFRFNPADLGLGGRAVGPNGPRDFFSPYGFIYDSDPFGKNYTSYYQVDASLDPLAIEACTNAKSQGIEIFSIAVSSFAGPGTNVYETLKSCANNDDHFFYATNASALNNAFADIAKKATNFVRTK